MHRRRQLRTTGLGLAILAAVGASAAGAAPIGSAGALCAANADPCRIDTAAPLPVVAGTVLDFGTRTLEVVRGGLDAGTGALTIHAGAVLVRSHGRLHAASTTDAGGTIAVVTTGDVTVEAGAGDAGEIDVSGTSGGAILLQAGGTVALAGRLRADGLAQDGDGGLVAIAAGSADTGASSTISATSGRLGAGGSVSIVTTGDALLDGDVNTAGGSGFGSPDVAIDAGGSLRLGGAIDASATLDDLEGDGGAIALRAAGGEVWVAGALDVRASTAGYGGSIDIDAAGPVTLRAPVTATGGAPDGSGGDVSIRADGAVEQALTAARIDAGATGIGSSGGSVTILARGGATFRGVDVSAGSEGGDVTVLADVGLRVVGPIGADGFGGAGLAGSIDLRTSGPATIEGTVHADAPPGELGGVVTVLACTLALPRGGTISANGASGMTLLRGDGALAVAGRLQAGAENRLATSGRGSSPLVTGTVTPPPTIAVDPAIVACGQTVATTSTTTTTTRTTTTRTTTTATTVPPSSSSTIPSTSTSSSTTTAPETTSTTTTSTTAATATIPSSTTTSSTATTSATTVPTTSSIPTTTTTGTSRLPTTSTTLPACDDPTCDDADPCSADACDIAVCRHSLPPEPDLLVCRIATVEDALDTADFSGARKLRARLAARLDRSRRLVGAALSRVGPKRVRSLQRAVAMVAAARRDVERASARQLLSTSDAERIATPLRLTAAWLDDLRATARRAS